MAVVEINFIKTQLFLSLRTFPNSVVSFVMISYPLLTWTYSYCYCINFANGNHFCIASIYSILPHNLVIIRSRGFSYKSTKYFIVIAHVLQIPSRRDSLFSNNMVRLCGSRDNSVGIATGYGLDDCRVGVRVPVGAKILSPTSCPDWLWGPLTLLPNV
jgi:hypothetical protein